ncbi:MAG: ribonuclease Z [Deltaproteobacteria bacterium]|nr:ribonuclease Z [Deltaproteobacteria bacterium]
MTSPFVPEFVNSPFGDPGVYISLPRLGTAILVDLGNLDRFPAAKIHRVSHILVSHTHIDHFVGFDRVLRLLLGRDTLVKIYGPTGIIDNVLGKIRGYTWNLIDGYPLVFEVFEVEPTTVRGVRLSAATAFSPQPLEAHSFFGVLCEQPEFVIRTTHLDHRIPSLAFAVEEPRRVNIRKDELERYGFTAGPWLEALKEAIRTNAPPETTVTATFACSEQPSQRLSIAELRTKLVEEAPGQKLAYVVDAGFTAPNIERIVDLARNADVFFCESPFVDVDREQAKFRYHLTARQAGSLARWASVKELNTFHFSPRYSGRAQELVDEARATYSGKMDTDVAY